MKHITLFIVIVILSAVGYYLGRIRSVKAVKGEIRTLHSLPGYYGFYVALWCGIPALIVLVLWIVFQ
ncbi:MAG TPA: phosphate ABC transporter permease subunit PstC, partial [Nitrospirae bacterium]|nr:phosphate ABC transporter permease subunit PstC [Nitrospirota bacterium]